MESRIDRIVKTVIPGIVRDPVFIIAYRLKKKLRALIIKQNIPEHHRWVDVGCGLRPYECFFQKGTYTGIDVENSGAESSMKKPDIYYNGSNLPYESNSIDGVICTQVLEHVPDAALLITEMARVIKLDGSIILSLPFVWQEHEEPFDFVRFSRFGITEILAKAGFEIEEMEKDSGSLETIGILTNTYIVNNLVPNIRGIGFICNVLICFPIQLISLVLQKILPDAGKLYINLVIKAKKVR